MKLLLDQGNSRLKWALVSSGAEIVDFGAEPNLPDAAAALSRIPIPDPELVAISCVAGSRHLDSLVQALRARWAAPLRVLKTPDATAGLVNGYANPASLGIDRWLAMLGARSVASGALLVVDAGTAVTVDAIDQGGCHLGGYIVPGVSLQVRSLAAGTAAISLDGRSQHRGWGRDTAGAVGGGVVLELASLVDRAVVELESRVADTCSLLLTGGDAALLASALRTPAVVDRDLVFRGMLVQLSDARGFAHVEIGQQ